MMCMIIVNKLTILFVQGRDTGIYLHGLWDITSADREKVSINSKIYTDF